MIHHCFRSGIDQSQAQQQNETKNLEHRLSKTLETTPKSSEIIEKLNELTKNIDPAIEKLSHDLQTIKTIVEKQPTSNEILEKINQITQQQKVPFEAALKDIHSKVEPLHQASRDVFPFTFRPLSSTSQFSPSILKRKTKIFRRKSIN